MNKLLQALNPRASGPNMKYNLGRYVGHDTQPDDSTRDHDRKQLSAPSTRPIRTLEFPRRNLQLRATTTSISYNSPHTRKFSLPQTHNGERTYVIATHAACKMQH